MAPDPAHPFVCEPPEPKQDSRLFNSSGWPKLSDSQQLFPILFPRDSRGSSCVHKCVHTYMCLCVCEGERSPKALVEQSFFNFNFIFLLLHMSMVSNTSQWALKFPCFQGLTSVTLSVPCHRWKEYNYGFSVIIDFWAPNHSKKGHKSTWLPLRKRICIWLFYLAEDTPN